MREGEKGFVGREGEEPILWGGCGVWGLGLVGAGFGGWDWLVVGVGWWWMGFGFGIGKYVVGGQGRSVLWGVECRVRLSAPRVWVL